MEGNLHLARRTGADMSRLLTQGLTIFDAGRALRLGAAMVVALGLLADGAWALPSALATQGMRDARATLTLPIRGGVCSQSCPDCTDCITEIDIAPVPYRERDDPIGHAIKRLEPSPLLAPDNCPETEVERLRGNPSGCGIRCWYWRLRHGYCGPGCEYYGYRLGRSEDASGPPFVAAPRPRHSCRS